MRRSLIVLLCSVVLVIAWERAAGAIPDVKFFISSPSLSWAYANENRQALWEATYVTGLETAAGFALAVASSGIFLLVSMLWPAFQRVVVPFFVTSQILPMITLAPLFIVLFGMGIVSKIAMVAVMCFFPIFVNFSAGVRSVPSQVLELLYVYDARAKFRILRILLPLSLPQGFVGLKVSTTMAIMGAIVAEFMGANVGLGKNLYLAPKSSEASLMVCSIALVVVVGLAFYGCVALLERLLCNWHLQKELSHG